MCLPQINTNLPKHFELRLIPNIVDLKVYFRLYAPLLLGKYLSRLYDFNFS